MAAKHLPYLDGWRGLAIACLLLGHFLPVPGLNFGTIGVNLFFVLSGLLMARLLFVEEVPIPTFYRRRISRIMPGFAVFLLMVLVAWILSSRPVSWTETAAAATFTTNYFMAAPENTLMPFGHIWSLSVEEHSYILLSLIAFGARAGRRPATPAVLAVAAACVCFAGLYAFMYSGRELNLHLAHSEVAAFGIFMSAGLFLVLRNRSLPAVPAFAYLGLVGIGFALHWWMVPAALRSLAGVAVFALAVNLLDAAPATIHRALQHPVLRQLGLWSFSIYVWQQPFYFLVHRKELSSHAGLALSIAAGIASYYLVERPARLYLNRHWGADRVVLAPAAPSAP